MEATDLRIGNIIHGHCGGAPHDITVEGVCKEGINPFGSTMAEGMEVEYEWNNVNEVAFITWYSSAMCLVWQLQRQGIPVIPIIK